MIEVRSVSKSFKGKEVLNKVNFCVQAGEKIAIVGPNGCGKSTIINIIAGLVKPDAGFVVVDSFAIMDASYRRLTGFVLDPPLYIEELSVKEMFEFNAAIYDLDSFAMKGRVDEMVGLLELDNELSTRVSDLSKGYKARVSLALSMLHHPAYLILDEPFNGIEERLTDKITRYLSESDYGIVITTHDGQLTSRLTTKAIQMGQ